jgi:hypothetical protein
LVISVIRNTLEFVHGVGLLDVAIHWKAPTSYHFLFVVAQRDVTTIRPTDYEEPKACKKIIGYDANALYL